MKPPLWLPVGSIRAILAIALVASVIVLAFLGRLEARELLTLAAVAVTFYFADRSKDSSVNGDPPANGDAPKGG